MKPRKYKAKLLENGGWGVQSPNGRIMFEGSEVKCREMVQELNTERVQNFNLFRVKHV